VGVDIDERAAFRSAGEWFRQVVGEVGDRWERPGLGEWTVRDLVGHTSRALITVATYLDAEPGQVVVESTTAYFLSAPQSGTAAAAVAERGREAGRALGEDPVAAVADLEERVQAKVASATDDAFVATVAGGMRLIDYLPTRTFELVVHTADLTSALGIAAAPPSVAAASALRLAADLALERESAVDVLLALTGRRPLPDGFSIV
jgi:uncharacterized protein (TIGR03083 family)